MWSFSDLTNKVSNWFTGDEDAQEKINKYLDEAKNVKSKSVEDSYKEGRSAAGMAAADKAGEAKKQAKAASVMNGGNKLQSAVAGASAAGEAASQGYDDTANQAASMDQQASLAEAQAQRDALTAKASSEQAKQDRKTQRMSSALSTAGSILASSDKNCKDFKKKYTYIPKEKRVNK